MLSKSNSPYKHTRGTKNKCIYLLLPVFSRYIEIKNVKKENVIYLIWFCWFFLSYSLDSFRMLIFYLNTMTNCFMRSFKKSNRNMFRLVVWNNRSMDTGGSIKLEVKANLCVFSSFLRLPTDEVSTERPLICRLCLSEERACVNFHPNIIPSVSFISVGPFLHAFSVTSNRWQHLDHVSTVHAAKLTEQISCKSSGVFRIS